MQKIGRNDPCPCGSGRKYKHCCLTSNALKPGGRPTDAASRAVRTGTEHHKAGRFEQARLHYEQALRVAPGHPDALHMLGLIAHQTGQHGLAVELISKAIAGKHSDPSYYVNLASALGALGRSPEALANCRTALAINPKFFDAHVGLGVALSALGALGEAEASFRKAVALKPNSSEARNNLGRILLDQGRSADAEASIRRAIALDPNNAVAYNNLGAALVHQGRSDEAAGCYQEAIALQPGYVAARYNLGNALKDWGRLEEAIESFRTALELSPDGAEIHNNLATTLQEAGRLDEALASLRKALELQPDFAEAHFNLHTLLLGAGDVEGAIHSLERVVALRPEDPEPRLFLGILLDRSGDAAGAARHFEAVEKGTAMDLARLDAWRYMKAASDPLPTIIGSPIDAFRIGMEAAQKEGLVLEFGVRYGGSIQQIAALANQHVHGFDSFQGIPEDWHEEPRGSYTTGGVIPRVPDNVTLHHGWFEETLPEFVQNHPGPVRLMNIDCDLYSSTRTVLGQLAGQIVPGTVIVFDEYLGHEHWREDEFRAFKEAVAEYGWRYEYLCFSLTTKQAVVRII